MKKHLLRILSNLLVSAIGAEIVWWFCKYVVNLPEKELPIAILLSIVGCMTSLTLTDIDEHLPKYRVQEQKCYIMYRSEYYMLYHVQKRVAIFFWWRVITSKEKDNAIKYMHSLTDKK